MHDRADLQVLQQGAYMPTSPLTRCMHRFWALPILMLRMGLQPARRITAQGRLR